MKPPDAGSQRDRAAGGGRGDRATGGGRGDRAATGSPLGPRVIGLTGGIASGKSLVAGLLRGLGAHVIDADAVAREVVRPGSDALREITAAFGAGVLCADGTLDRKALAARIFADPQARLTLNAITHPRIRRRIVEEIEAVRASRPEALIVVDVPLLLDVAPPDAYPFDGILLVFADEAAQVARLRARDGLTEEAARQRLASQRPLREKVPLATWVIDNSGSVEQTSTQTKALWEAWRRRQGNQSQGGTLHRRGPVLT